MTSADERQNALLRWMRLKPLLPSRTTSEIADHAGRSWASDDDKALYGPGYAKYNLCRLDLNKLLKDGSVEKIQGYPTEWRII